MGRGYSADEVAATCTAAGLRVEKVLHAVGVVIGTCDDEHPPDLAGLPGVGSVEPDGEVHLDR
ncbi:hypothetical protein PSA01_61580 [Pseudonocardia saturnea]|uniref:ANTAR domain-containing protein n=1 Tax=Pseudonocardia saturnea TaxID=33909 RepID=A0ABQ0S873_9PSEU|nr:hypothetical protein Pdca_21970 [Pseudonocardia autotrophica]GEC29129.1 hypothetical protein PSA01_61580 [Pseudonocardia saturnea]